MVLSSAILWHTAYQELETLGNRQWLDSLVCDFYLASIWHDSGDNALCRFLMIFRLRPDLHITPMEIDTYRHAHHVPTNEDCPKIPVAFLVHDVDSAHYFAVVFDYVANIAHVFGRKIGDHNPQYDPDWRAWQGPERWKIIADLHHWNAEDPEMVFVISRDWRQNGYDCGPIACAIIKRCMEDGLEDTQRMFQESPIDPPSIPCGHVIRLNMLATIRQRCMISFQHYMHFVVHPPPHWDYVQLDDEIIQMMQAGGDVERDNRLLRSLTLASNSCWDCQAFIARQAAKESRNVATLNEDQDHEQEDLEELEDQDKDEEDQQQNHQGLEQEGQDRANSLLALLRGHKILNGARLCRAHRPARAVNRPTRNAIKNKGMSLEEEQDLHNRAQLSNAAGASCRRVKDWRLGTLQHFPRVSRPVFLDAYRGRRFLTHDHQYDDYDDGPTLEMLQQPEVYSILTHPFEHMVQAPAWIMWRDHGYRLLPESFQMFYLAQPIQIMDHVMTIGKVVHKEHNQMDDQVG